MLFGGDSLNVKVKYQGDAVVSLTPCIILSNKFASPNDDALKCRMISYKFLQCLLLY